MSYKSRNGIRESPEVRRAVRIFRKLQKKLKSSCVVCGRPYHWWNVFHVHHKFPVSIFPEQAANAKTFRWCHSKCHLIVGHGGEWSRYQSEFDEVTILMKVGLNPNVSSSRSPECVCGKKKTK